MTAELKTPGKSQLRGHRRPLERAIVISLFLAGALSIAITIGILWELGKESLLFFQDEEVSFWGFLTTTTWQPQAGVSASGRSSWAPCTSR